MTKPTEPTAPKRIRYAFYANGGHTIRHMEGPFPTEFPEHEYTRSDVAAEAEIDRRNLLSDLKWMVKLVDSAGVNNLSNGVQLGPVAWHVKMTDAMNSAKHSIEVAEGRTPNVESE